MEKQQKMTSQEASGLKIMVWVMIILIGILGVLPLVNASNLKDNLVSYWTFNETTGNNAVNAFNGINNFTIVGTANWIQGRTENGIKFYGNPNEYANITNLNLGLGSNFAVQEWINISAFSNNIMGIFSYTDGGNLGIDIEKDAGVNRFLIIIGTGTTTKTMGTPIMTAGQWQHIVLTNNATSILLYLNGTLVNSTAGITAWDTTSNLILSGQSTDVATTSRMFNGTIDEVGIWGRSLSENEVVELYNNGYGSNYSSFTFSNITVSLNLPNNNFLTLFSMANFSANFSSHNGFSLKNATLFIWDSYGNLATNSTNITGTINGTEMQQSGFTSINPYLWNYYVCANSSTNTFCGFADSNRTVSLNNFQFGICNSILTTKYLNITFKNETASQERVKAAFISSFEYSLTGISGTKSYSFSNTTENLEYLFCSNHSGTLIVTPNVQYYNSYSSQRIWGTAFSTMLNKTLYLLPNIDGIYVTFQVVDAADSPISGVTANVTRVLGDSDVVVGSGTTGDDGGITYWLNPNYVHTFTFAKAGYITLVSVLTPTQSQYTAHLTSSSAINLTIPDYNKDISYTIQPNASYLINNTEYNFTFTISSGYWSISSFGFQLWNSTTLLASVSKSENGGVVSYNLNTINNSLITMKYFWVVDGIYTNVTTSWWVLDTSSNEWSIKTFFIDLKNYMVSGMFGLDNFGLALLTFFSIFIIAGIMSWKYGLSSPAAIMGILFALTLFFDVGLSIIPYPEWISSSIPVATIFMGIIFVGVLFREVSQ
jgi:hypothetical protein